MAKMLCPGFPSASRKLSFRSFSIANGEKDSPSLNGKYTVFGEVVKGMEVADKIVSQPRDARDNPLERIEMTVKIVE